jgi:hypothetical protein
MCPEHDDYGESFEDKIRALARELGGAAERLSGLDVDELAGALGVDPDRARRWFETAGSWVRAQAEGMGEQQLPWGPTPWSSRAPAAPAQDDPLRSAAPHPLDLPTDEQGIALAALDSGRWTVEAGTSRLSPHREGPAPNDALGLVRELQVRDWIASDGELTLAGRHALGRWLESATDR